MESKVRYLLLKCGNVQILRGRKHKYLREVPQSCTLADELYTAHAVTIFLKKNNNIEEFMTILITVVECSYRDEEFL